MLRRSRRRGAFRRIHDHHLQLHTVDANDAQLESELDRYVKEYGANVVEDYQYELDMPDVFEAANFDVDDSANPSHAYGFLKSVREILKITVTLADSYCIL